ncbi:hypothetical protein [Rubrivirga sp. IMCC43871]|uniref:hypothetical protein n=1 Tax=Rubrivirga sp. IMCC43871 TaxID=3391575 RepID=UPI00398FD810
MPTALLSLLLCLVLAVPAVAHPARTPRAPVSAHSAVGLSIGVPIVAVALGATAADSNPVGTALIVAGVFAGPSAGNLVQGDYGEALVGTGLRVAGAAAVGYAFARAFNGTGANALNSGLAVAGVGAFGIGTGYDVVTAARAPKRSVEISAAGAGLAVRVGL